MRIISRVGIGKNPTSHHLDVTGSANFDSQVFFQNNVFLNANVDLGNASSDLIAFNGRCTTSIVPNTNENLNFGSSSLFWQTTYSRNLMLKNAGSIESDGNTVNIGTVSSTTINIGKSGTTINLYGSVNKIQSTDTEVFDKLITLNKNGLSASASGSGFEIEENAVITAFFKTTSDRNEWLFKAPGRSGIISLAPGSSAFTHKIIAQATADRTWTLPDNTDTFVGTTNAQTLDNKTLNNTTTTGTLTVNSTNTINGATTVNNTITSNSSATFTGNIGIGTTSPSYKLHTVGTGYFAQDVILAATSGNVGIGTTSPSSKLHISAGDSSLALFGPNATWAGNLVVGASASQIGVKKAQVIVTDGNLHLDSGTSNVTYINYYSQTNTLINGQGGSVGIGLSSFGTDAFGETFKLQVNKSVGAKSFQCDNWFRSAGNSGWYSQSYGGGIWMTDTTWVRVYGSKNFYCDSEIRANRITTENYIYAANYIAASGYIYGYSRIQPSAGIGDNGIIWGSDPGGGSGDVAYIKYWALWGERCRFEYCIENDPEDDIMILHKGHNGWTYLLLGQDLSLTALGDANIYGNTVRAYYRGYSMQFALQSDGNAVIYQGGWARWSSNTVVSDIRVKRNIEEYQNVAMNTIKQLKVKTFKYIESMEDNDLLRVGFIAQEVQNIIPQAIKCVRPEDDEQESLVLFKEEIVPFLVKGMQEQQQQIELQQKKIELLEAKINAINIKQ